MKRDIESTLPSLEQTLDDLAKTERKYPDGLRIEETRKAIEANERFAKDRQQIDTYLGYLGSRKMFTPIYGLGNFPQGLPVCLPPYLMDLLIRTSKVLCALARKNLAQRGPEYLIERMPKGWLTSEMAERLHEYFLTHEPDMGFDVLVYGKNSHRGMTFDEFKKSKDMLHAKLLEAQSVDTYFGWVREFIIGSRKAGLRERHQFTWCKGSNGQILADEDLYRQVVSTLNYGFENDVDKIVFLEIEPEKQASGQNLVMMADAMCGYRTDPKLRPVILDPGDLELRGDSLVVTKPGLEREIKKVISRIVDVDLQGFIKVRESRGEQAVVERLKRIYQQPQLFRDLSKHLAGFYLIDKSMLTDMSLLGSVSMAPKTELVSEKHMEMYRKDPELLHKIAIKPLHGMSAKGVIVGPTLEQLEQSVAQEQMLVQATMWATPILPNVKPEIQDPDVQAGICCEARLVYQAGSPAVAHQPYEARIIAGLSRSHFQSKDAERRIKNDSKGRGWYSNVGAILAVKAELGLAWVDDAGIGMAPIYSCIE